MFGSQSSAITPAESGRLRTQVFSSSHLRPRHLSWNISGSGVVPSGMLRGALTSSTWNAGLPLVSGTSSVPWCCSGAPHVRKNSSGMGGGCPHSPAGKGTGAGVAFPPNDICLGLVPLLLHLLKKKPEISRGSNLPPPPTLPFTNEETQSYLASS